MNRILKNAVWAAIAILCAAVSSCDSYDFDEVNQENQVIEQSCVTVNNVFNASGVVATRASETGTPDGQLTATSNHKKTFVWNFNPIERTYQGFNYVKAYNVNRPRYTRNIDIFKNPTWSEKVLDDNSVLQVVHFLDGATHDFDISLLETQYYDTDTVMVAGKTFQKCKNNWVERKLIGAEITDLQRDSADWHAYKVILNFHYALEEGENREVNWYVALPTVWEAKSGTNPDIPDNDHEIISYDDGDRGIEILNDSIADSWIDIIPKLSNGEDGTKFRKHVYLKYKLTAPEYKIVPVPDFLWSASAAKASDPVKNGDLQSRSDSTFVQPYIQSFTTYTTKCDAVFFGEYEGAAYWIDPQGKAHMFLDAKWSFKDNGWKESDLSPIDNLKRLLLTSNISATYLTQKPTAKGEVELRASQDGGKSVVKFTYTDFGIRAVKPMDEYWSYATQTAVYSDGTTSELGEIGVKIYVSVNAPEEQTIQVYDWNIADGQPQLYNPQDESSRNEKVATGTFKVGKFARDYVTTTNKSDHKFTSHAETSVIFTDSLGKETQFKGLELKYDDNGSAKTLQSLSDQDEKERKSMTPSIKVTVNGSDHADYSAKVNFWKAIEKEEEELINNPNNDYTQTLTYQGNGIWNSTTTITYVWKLAGTKTETYSQNLEWSLAGEALSQVILDNAEAPYLSLNEGTWSAETSSTPQNDVTLYTKTNTTISENYTTLTDKFTSKQQRAVINKTVGGKNISIAMLAPTGMTFSHKDGSLVDGNRTTTQNGTEYNVWDHTGSVTALVTSSVGNQTETATDEKEVLVEKEEIPISPANPAWGFPVSLVQASLTYHPYVGDSGQGAFHKTLVVKFENGLLIVTTASYGREKAWNPIDFTFDEGDFYYYSGTEPAGTDASHVIPSTAKINSAALFDGRWKPALLTMQKDGWTYAVDATHIVNMSKNLAETCGIKNFTGNATADVTPFLNYSSTLAASKVLAVKNENGQTIFSMGA